MVYQVHHFWEQVGNGLGYDIYYELKELGQFGESFNDIIIKLIDSYHSGQGGAVNGPAPLDRDQVKARLKKFDSHTRAISRLVRENISYSVGDK